MTDLVGNNPVSIMARNSDSMDNKKPRDNHHVVRNSIEHTKYLVSTSRGIKLFRR